jgi:hypothetical protein
MARTSKKRSSPKKSEKKRPPTKKKQARVKKKASPKKKPAKKKPAKKKPAEKKLAKRQVATTTKKRPAPKKAKKRSSSLPTHVEAAMRNAGLRPEDRDERGLMPLDAARKQLRGLKTVVRGESREINDTHVWESDLSWAALLSLADEKELVRMSALDWKMPPRGLDNPGVAERYGEGAIDWVNGHLKRDSEGPGFACLAATALENRATPKAFDCAVRLDARRPDQLVLWKWLRKNPKGWEMLASALVRNVPDRVEALARLAQSDAKGAFAALAGAKSDASARAAFESAGVNVPAGAKAAKSAKGKAPRSTISIGAIEPHFKDFTYPMWDNMNYFTGAMRVTGFVCDEGEALVWEQLCTGLGEGSVRREVTVHASFTLKHPWRTHVDELLGERAITKWNGEDFECLLSGVACVGGKYAAPAGGSKKSARVEKLGIDVPLEIDSTGLGEADAKLLLSQTGPAERLMIRLGQSPYREMVFPSSEELAREAGLPKGAHALFRFDSFEMPAACEPAASSADIVAMVDALASRSKLERLPSHTRDPHPLGYLIERVRSHGGWGDTRLSI